MFKYELHTTVKYRCTITAYAVKSEIKDILSFVCYCGLPCHYSC